MILSKNLDNNFTIEYLAKEVGTNVINLQKIFKKLYDLIVNKYMQQVKVEAAKDMLTSSEFNISQILLTGLNNRSYFSKIFKEKFGVSPKYCLINSKSTHIQKSEKNE